MSTDVIAMRSRVVLALVTIVSVAFTEIGLLFCFNAPLSKTGLLTSALIFFVLARLATSWVGARGGVLVGITSLGCVPFALVFGNWEAHGLRSSPTSDSDDFALLVLLVLGFAATARFAIQWTRTAVPSNVRAAIRTVFFGAAALSLVLIALHVRRPSITLVSAALGLVAATVEVALARRALAQHDSAATGWIGTHTGGGTIELEDGRPRIHRPDLADRPRGPVVVLGNAEAKSGGYREMPTSEGTVLVTFGTPASIREEGAARSASHHAVGLAVVAYSALSLVNASYAALR